MARVGPQRHRQKKNVLVNSAGLELVCITEHVTLYKSCGLTRYRYNRVRLWNKITQ
jgi:hypothetical protein